MNQVKNIEISTMKINVASIQVEGKQMTLAVFRQLPINCIYNSNYSINENINLWGVVRYQIPGYLNSIWVIFEKDGILYKGNIDPPNKIPSVEGLEADIEFLKESIKECKYGSKKKYEIFKKNLIKKQMELLTIINGHKNVKKIKSLRQLFIAI